MMSRCSTSKLIVIGERPRSLGSSTTSAPRMKNPVSWVSYPLAGHNPLLSISGPWADDPFVINICRDTWPPTSTSFTTSTYIRIEDGSSSGALSRFQETLRNFPWIEHLSTILGHSAEVTALTMPLSTIQWEDSPHKQKLWSPTFLSLALCTSDHDDIQRWQVQSALLRQVWCLALLTRLHETVTKNK